jgi:hypothetical protein
MSTDDPLSPAEACVAGLLADLREDAPPAGDVVASVTRTVRWQRPLRHAFVSVGNAAGSIAGGLLFLVRRRP